uniref:Uncharacterized protein n=1 Tax=Amphimedon queenslandica TaxID=400682 RepID=A0A1X7SG92_AMPQE
PIAWEHLRIIISDF